jgi:WD40 repeat protein
MPVNWLAYGPDGSWIASASEDRTVQIWDPANGNLIRKITTDEEPVGQFTFTADGQHLISLVDSRVWNTETGQRVDDFFARYQLDSDVKIVGISPDGRWLVFEDGDSSTRAVLDTSRNETVLTIEDYYYSPVFFSPDGQLMASDGGEGVTIWDLTMGEKIVEIAPESAWDLAFSPDGRRMVSGTGVVWDLLTGQDLILLEGMGGSVVFSPDGERIAAACGDGVRIWYAPISSADAP